MTSLPADLQRILEQLDAADTAADTLVAHLSDGQFQWQPDEGRSWSVGQCLEHIAAINVLYGDAVRGAIDTARRRGWTRTGPAAPGVFGRWFIKGQEPPVKRRFRAPAKVRPGSELTRAEIMARYHDTHAHFRRLVGDAATIDTNRATFPNPFFGLLSVSVATALHLIPAHDRRHLWQAEQVIRRTDFPRT